MTVRTLALDWTLEGATATAFLVLVGAAGLLYLLSAAVGKRRDRRRRRWSRRRTACFLGGLLALVVDLYSGIGAEADTRLTMHMIEHTVMWLVVAPLLAAGAPVRLAFYALPRGGRRALARGLHSDLILTLTSPIGATVLFLAVVLASQVPAVYGLTLQNVYVHEAEHGLYLLSAVIMWANLLRVDPLPRRPRQIAPFTCMVVSMIPMALIAIWLQVASTPVYAHYTNIAGRGALSDQRVAAAIMWAGAILMFAAPLMVTRLRLLRRRVDRRPQATRATAWSTFAYQVRRDDACDRERELERRRAARRDRTVREQPIER